MMQTDEKFYTQAFGHEVWMGKMDKNPDNWVENCCYAVILKLLMKLYIYFVVVCPCILNNSVVIKIELT